MWPSHDSSGTWPREYKDPAPGFPSSPLNDTRIALSSPHLVDLRESYPSLVHCSGSCQWEKEHQAQNLPTLQLKPARDCKNAGSGLPKVPQTSAEPLKFSRKVLQNVSHSKKPIDARSGRTAKVLQNFGNQAQLFRPCKFFSQKRGYAIVFGIRWV